MKFLAIFVALMACCYAAPTTDLPHPSPINPSVLVEVKPQEIENKQNLAATSLADEIPHHISKRDHKAGHDTKPKTPEPPKQVSKPHHEPPKQEAKKPVSTPHHEPPKSSPSSNKRNRRHTEIFEQPQTLPAVLTELAEPTKEVFQKPQTLPEIIEDKESVQQHKRDIPVPLVPKHPHPEESPKDSSEEDSSEEEKKHEKNSKPIVPHENHPNKDEVQVEDLSEHKPIHETLHFDHAIPAVVTSTKDEEKPVTLEEPENSSTHYSTEHPVSRPKPVPVAELFARAHDDN